MPAAKATPETISCSHHRRSLAATAYQTLYSKIISLDYHPGQPLEEATLVDELGIGRTPVREALQRLSADLLVESQPGKGFVVRSITLQNTKAAFAALQILELGVAELAVRQENRLLLEAMREANVQVAEAVNEMDIYRLVEANSTFHDAYARCSDNIYLVLSLQKVRCETNRLAYLSFGNEIDPERNLKLHYASVIDQHNGVIEALGDRDADRLKALIVEHIGIFKNRIIHYLTEF